MFNLNILAGIILVNTPNIFEVVSVGMLQELCCLFMEMWRIKGKGKQMEGLVSQDLRFQHVYIILCR